MFGNVYAAFNSNSFGTGIGVGGFYAGKLDEVRIWSIARTQASIRDDYQKKLLDSESGLSHYLAFESITPNGASHTVTTSAGIGAGGTALTLTSGAVSPYQYQWSGPGGFSSTVSQPLTFIPSQSGVYTVATGVPGAMNCTATASVSVLTCPNLNIVSIPAKTSIVLGERLQLATSGTLPAGSSLTWSNPKNYKH
jgi:hypothetical protein